MASTSADQKASTLGSEQASYSAVSLCQVTKVYRLAKGASVVAVCDLSLEVAAGEFLVITGRSGSGKTTLLNLAAGLSRPTSGEARLEGADLWRLPDHQRSWLRNQKIGFIFQFPSLLPSLTALENVVLPTTFGPSEGRREARARAVGLLEEVGLRDKLDAYPRQLSAGQQKRVVVARSLVNRPRLLLADEPTSDLDEETEQEIMNLLQRLHAGGAITVVMVTHSRDLIRFATRSVEMARGTMVG